MNVSTIALLLLAWQLLTSNTSADKRRKPNLTEFFSDDTKDILNCVGKLSGNASGEDKMGAILQMASNPTVMNLVQNMFPQGAEKQNAKENDNKNDKNKNPLTNEEGYTFETPSEASREFFRPIDNIADAEVKHKLYWFYDNWYVK